MQMHPKVHQAFAATRALGIPDEEIKPVLKKLFKLYNKNWELIEENNYQTLIDSYYECEDDKETGDKKAHATNGDLERPLKREKLKGKIPSDSLDSNTVNIVSSEEDTVLTPSKKMELAKPEFMDANGSGSSNHQNKLMTVPKTEDAAANLPRSNEPKKTVSSAVPYPCETSSAGDRSGYSAKKAYGANGVPNTKRPKIQDSESNGKKRSVHTIADITKGTENVKIVLVDETGVKKPPSFNYIPHNIVFQDAHVSFSLARISDEDCCSGCSGNCISLTYPCACARETGGEFAYTMEGQLKEEFLDACLSRKNDPQQKHFFYCQLCPEERIKNEEMPEKCKGHLFRKFIKECWRKCGCNMQCGNRVVQRGITSNLQVFWTRDGKGWGVRAIHDLPKGAFVCEYIGEVVTNMELYNRNLQSSGNERHTYPVTLDADWGSEGVLDDKDALCLDATSHGNVARFINHRCFDANLIDIPVEIETPDRHYYHLAFFTTRKISAFEELTWDYGIDFDDHDHPVKAFRCCCRSKFCRGKDTRRS